MTSALVIALASISALIGACDRVATTRSNPNWMVGKWGWIGSSERHKLKAGECSQESEFYGANGFVTGDDVSRWWIEGDRLIRVTVEPFDDDLAMVGHTHIAQFTRLGATELLFEDQGSDLPGDESSQRLIRCGDVPPEWLYEPRTGRRFR